MPTRKPKPPTEEELELLITQEEKRYYPERSKKPSLDEEDQWYQD